jgi:hypothetical protein
LRDEKFLNRARQLCLDWLSVSNDLFLRRHFFLQIP